MNAEAHPRALSDDTTRGVEPVDVDRREPTLNRRPPRPSLPWSGRSIPGDALGRFTFAVLFIGTLLLAWKLHMFKLPSQIATERATALGKPLPKSSFFGDLFEWLTPWRWGRGDMLSKNLATGGDMGAHVWSSDYVARSLFPKFRLTGWSNDWFAGFPVLNFYFPLPTLVIGVLRFILPANVAFKLVTALGVMLLPTTSWASAKLAQLPRPIPLMAGLVAFPFVLSRHYDLYIYGGNIASTMAGEFSFSLSVAFGVLFLGLFTRALTTGQYRGRAAIALAATGLCHLLPTIWVLCVSALILLTHLRPSRMKVRNGRVLAAAVGGALVLGAIVWVTIDHKYGLVLFGAVLFALALIDLVKNLFGARQVRDALLVLGTGGAIAGFWLVPFAHNLPYTNDMGWEKMKLYKQNLFPFWGPKPYPDSHIIAVAMIFAAVAAISAFVSLARSITVSTENRLGIPAPTLVGASLCAAAAGLIIGLVFGKPSLGLILGATLLVVTFVLALVMDAPIEGRAIAGLAIAATVVFLASQGTSPGHLIFVTGLWAVVVTVVAGLRGLEYERLGFALTLTAGVCVAFFVQTPQFRLWNARVLPFWFLTVYLLAAQGAYRAGRAAIGALRLYGEPRRSHPGTAMVGAVGATMAVFIAVGLPLNLVPNSMPIPKVKKGLIGVQTAKQTTDSNFSPGWALYNYRGYQGAGGWNEYKAVMDKANVVGKTNGCGRVLWEYEDAKLGSFGTTLAFMLLPYWTKGCLQSFEGVYFESSATMPWHWLTAALITTPLTNNADGTKKFSGPSNPQRDLPYGTFDLVRGVEKMKDSGVRYYLAFTDPAIAAANSMPDKLRKVDQVGKCTAPGATPDPSSDGKSCFTFYEVIGSSLVSPLTEEPQIVKGIDQDQYGGWLDVETDWYNNPASYPKTIAWTGPKTWRTFTANVNKPKDVRTWGAGVTTKGIGSPKPLPPVTVSNISLNNTDMKFSVDRVGVPMLVKVSYFPNWTVEGAKGPYRVMPNFMVVIPTKKDVHLHYGYSGADKLGYAATFSGIAMVAFLHVTRRRNPLVDEADETDGAPTTDDPPADGDAAAFSGDAETSADPERFDDPERADGDSRTPTA